MENQQEKYQSIVDEINDMYRIDQEMRNRHMKGDVDIDYDLDIKNTNKVREIIEEIGYPTISKVGKDPSYNFWILIQHADHDREFQKHCLTLMKELSVEDIDPKNIAYLEDRVRSGEGRSILYGTQYRVNKDTDEIYILPIEDEENVDKRRASVGLPPLKEYIDMANKKRKEVKSK